MSKNKEMIGNDIEASPEQEKGVMYSPSGTAERLGRSGCSMRLYPNKIHDLVSDQFGKNIDATL
jgi:hypothetical protein